MHRRSVFALPLRATIEFPGSNPLVIFVICESRGFYALCLVKLSALGAIGRFSCSAESTLICVRLVCLDTLVNPLLQLLSQRLCNCYEAYVGLESLPGLLTRAPSVRAI